MGLLAVSLILWYCDIVFLVHSMRWWSHFLCDQHLLGLLWLNWRTWGFPVSSNPLIHCFTMMSPKGWNRPTDLQFWPLKKTRSFRWNQMNISHRLHPFEASWRSSYFFPTFLEFLYMFLPSLESLLPLFQHRFLPSNVVKNRSFSVMQMWWWRAPQSWTLPRRVGQKNGRFLQRFFRGSSSHLVPVTPVTGKRWQFWKSHGFPENRLQMVDVPHLC